MSVVFFSILIVCIVLIVFSRPRRRDGLAPEGGSRIKNVLAAALVKSGAKRRPDWQSASLADGRVPVPEAVEEENYNDSFVFQGAGADGSVLLTRLGFRSGGKEAEVWFWGVFDGERYANDERIVELTSDADPSEIAAAGLKYELIAEGEWRLTYNGTLNGTPSEVSLIWKADAAMYCSADHMDTRGTARAMAEMPWSREYFERIRSEKQVRIEQGGILTGTVRVGGRSFDIGMRGIRDHSWGKRDWTYLNRYLWTVIALDEETEIAGLKVTYLAVSPVDYGDSFKRLASGWVAGPDGVLPVSFATDLMEVGGDGTVPGKFTLQFRVPGSKVLTLEVDRRQPEIPWLMQNGEFEVNEAWCGITLDGVKGVGLSEFGYAADRGYDRPFERERE
ncbi:MAG: hypothetical protein KAJ98_06000 [Spirochaetaceae bacterium]|nr:hypothetical protein [Spirochaetaceae bacterium]